MFLIAFLTILVMLLTNDGWQIFSIPIANYHITIRDIFLILSMGCMLFYSRAKTNKKDFLFGPLIASIFLFFSIYLIYGLLVNDIKVAILQFRQTYFILFYFVLVFLFKKKDRIIKLFKSLNFFMIILGVETLILFMVFWGKELHTRNAYVWIEWIFGTPIPRIVVNGAFYFIVFVPIVLSFLFEKPIKFKKSMSFLLMIIASIITFTRSIWIGILFSMLFLLFFTKKVKIKRLIVLFFVIILVSLIVLFSPLFTGILHRTSIEEGAASPSVLDRIAQHIEGQKIVSLHPLIGNGFGKTIHFYFITRQEWDDAPFPDDSYLGYLINFGFLGTIILLGLYLFAIQKALRLSRSISNNLQKTIAYGLIAGFIGILISSIFTTKMLMASGFFYFGFFLGCVEILYLKREELKEVNI